ncbi:MAG: hypothetical protein N2170_02750 [Bacteroidia bacterium]|nr:hypothetical protein [Bacteroidia bacterium]
MAKSQRIIGAIAILLLVAMGGIWMYRQFIHPPRSPALWQNIPKDFQLVVYTPSFIRSWKQLRHSPLAEIWSKSPHLAEPFRMGQLWDSVLREAPQLFEWVGNRGVLLSLHPEGKLYLIEAPFLAKIGDWRTFMQETAKKHNWEVTLVEKEGYAFWKLPTGYLAPAGEMLAYSTNTTLLTRFLRGNEAASPPWRWDETTWGDSPPWLSIGWQGKLLYQALSHPTLVFLDKILWGEIHLRLTEEGLYGSGEWLYEPSFWEYTAPSSFGLAELCPTRTQALISFHITDPLTFYRSHLRPLHAQEIETMEKAGSFSVEELFFSHLTGEMGIAQSEYPFLLFRLKEPEKLQHYLTTLREKVAYGARRQPLHRLLYRGYTLQQVPVGGLLRWFLGPAFTGWENPYFLQVGEWLIVARSPLILQEWIDAYIHRRTLYEKEDFSSTIPSLPTKPVLLAYFQPTPPGWLQSWLPSARYLKWKAELAPWHTLYIAISTNPTHRLTCALQLSWQPQGGSPRDSSFSSPPSISLPFSASDTTLEGTQEEYYPNGVVKRRITYVEGQPEGEYWEYHPNGVIKVQGYYEQGQKVGRWRYFSPKGELLREESWGQEEENPMSNESEK